MLVKLYTLPDVTPLLHKLALHGTTVRRAMAYEKTTVVNWVEQAFGHSAPGWKSEGDVAFSRIPIACHIAIYNTAIIGFVCHDCTAPNFLGPIGVAANKRGAGVGKFLLITALQAMRDQGYAYAIIGQAGSPDFFTKTVGAIEIPESELGIYLLGLE
jgi:GNAT superfamily N-acetyltransferase